ncbi:unnamed protein product [Rotaria sp. Silwood1]|nr:unnamed protein product [Rotaria sp. Silwood1]
MKDSDRHLSQRNLATEYKISTDDVRNIFKRKQEYLDDFELNQCHEKEYKGEKPSKVRFRILLCTSWRGNKTPNH